ncbi:MAG TPA: sigma-70 family RNA polymerase sigma factor [Polyangia bacterium]|nr:sigma-70 family RNA polymerase sigma factor [Polyangia bacterium]
MNESERLAERFEVDRPRLRAVAYRMLGSLSEADDAVQQSWLHLTRSGTTGVESLSGWLTTVVARVCLDMLRARKTRREEPVGANVPESIMSREGATDPEQEAALADSVGLALLVVLETLTPAERLAFVLHEMFDLSFDEIAPIVGRSATAARQLASRARRRVQGANTVRDVELTRQREVVDAYLAAVRGGNLNALLAVLDPDVIVRADPSAVPPGVPTVARGAHTVARYAIASSGRSRFAQVALVNGAIGIVFAPRGRLLLVLGFTVAHEKIVEIDVIGDPARLKQLDLAVLID